MPTVAIHRQEPLVSGGVSSYWDPLICHDLWSVVGQKRE